MLTEGEGKKKPEGYFFNFAPVVALVYMKQPFSKLIPFPSTQNRRTDAWAGPAPPLGALVYAARPFYMTIAFSSTVDVQLAFNRHLEVLKTAFNDSKQALKKPLKRPLNS